MNGTMRNILEGIGQVWAVNGFTIAVITLTDIREVMAIILAIVSIASTVIIIRKNLSNREDK
jgi:hypothetical protein